MYWKLFNIRENVAGRQASNPYNLIKTERPGGPPLYPSQPHQPVSHAKSDHRTAVFLKIKFNNK